MPNQDELDTAQLADSYETLGELAGRDDARVTLARRKADGLPVLISTYHEPPGDEGNALSHLASDAKILVGHPHPAVVRVLESRWVGNNALAIVTERVDDASLEDRLSRRNEDFPFPRIATLLREINAVLEWAREQGLVHRALRPDSVFVSDGSDRPRVMFSAGALSARGIPDERDDARTIAALARAMLTRSVADPERDALPLAELRPGLPARVVAQTEALLGRADSLEPVDVRAYIASLAMSEELKRGEEEISRVTREMSEEQRMMREQLAAERKAHEEDLAEQARRFEKEREDILKEMAREREEAARALAKERDEGNRALRQERERFEKEIRKQRAVLAREQEKLARARESFQRERAKAREQIAAKLAALRAQADLYAQTSELPAVLAEPFHEPEPEPASDPLAADEPFDEIVNEPVETAVVVAAAASASEATARPVPRMAPGWGWRAGTNRRHRMIGIAAVALLVVIAAAALAFSRRGNGGVSTAAGRAPVELRVVDSLGGVSTPLTADSMTAPAADSVATATEPAPRPVRRPPPAREERQVARDTVVSTDAAGPPIIPGMPAAAAPLPFARTDSVLRPDSVRRDSALRRDTAVRRDTTIRRDTIVGRDTLPPGPDSLTPTGAR